jgi:hypothetical protein
LEEGGHQFPPSQVAGATKEDQIKGHENSQNASRMGQKKSTDDVTKLHS